MTTANNTPANRPFYRKVTYREGSKTKALTMAKLARVLTCKGIGNMTGCTYGASAMSTSS
jgi:hypothetical protein